MIHVPLRTVSGMNAREHHMARARRVKGERQLVAWLLASVSKPIPPLVVTLTRIAPSNGLDPDDNLPSALKEISGFVLILVVLMVRPFGLFGEKRIERV